MIRRLVVLGVGASLVGLLPLGTPPAGAATKEIQVGPGGVLTFDPSNVTIAVGDTVQWTKAGVGGGNNTHNVHSLDGLFRFGEPGTGDPTPDAFTATLVFASGRFRFTCSAHPVEMNGVVKVPVKLLKKPAGPKFTARWATKNSGVFTAALDWVYDVQYRIGNGKWKNWFADTSKRGAVFGKNKRPLPVVEFKGKKVSIRARTQKAGSPAVVSGWSPIRSIKAR